MKGMPLKVVILMLEPRKLERFTRSLTLPKVVSLDLHQAKRLPQWFHGYRANDYRRESRWTKHDFCQRPHLAHQAGKAGTSFSPPQATHTPSKSASAGKDDPPISGGASLWLKYPVSA